MTGWADRVWVPGLGQGAYSLSITWGELLGLVCLPNQMAVLDRLDIIISCLRHCYMAGSFWLAWWT